MLPLKEQRKPPFVTRRRNEGWGGVWDVADLVGIQPLTGGCEG
jgi:hypothetical protein